MEDKELGLSTEKLVLNFGPQHPATHGTLQLVMELSGEVAVKVTPQMGYLHTGFEKLSEHLDYNQFICVTDRMNYLSPLNNNIGFSLAVEKLLDIEVPERAQYIRVIMAELSRISDHLVSIGMQALDLGAFSVFLYLWAEREKLYDLFEWVCGSRLTTSYMRIGGLMRDLPEGYEEAMKKFCKEMPKVLNEVETLLNRNKIWIGRTRDVGTISSEEAINWGLTGPVLRASNVNWDIRKVEPYLVYNELDFDIPVGENGDVFDRYLVRMEEMKQSLRIVEQAVEKLPGGPVDVDNPKIRIPKKDEVYNTMEGLIYHFEIFMKNRGFIPPVGEIYSSTEVPNGELGFFIVSDGGRSPYRVRIRPPSLLHYQVFPRMMEGRMLSDAVAILGSLNIIAGELDR